MAKNLRTIHKTLFSALIVLIPTQLGYHFWPEWAHVLGRRVDYLAPTVYLTDILIGLTLLSWVIEAVTGRRIRYYGLKSIIRNTRTIIPFLLFIGFNIYFAANRPIAIYKWLKVLEFVALAWYVVKTKVKLSSLSYPLLVGILYSSLIAIGQFMIQHSIGGPLWWLGERTFSLDTPGIARAELCNLSRVSCRLFLRPYATFPHPNVLGGYIAAILPLIASALIRPITQSDQSMKQLSNGTINQWRKQTRVKKIFYFVTFAMGIVALVLTFSRGAIAVGAIGIGVTYYALWAKKKIFFFSLIPYAIPLLLFLIVIFQNINRPDESVVVRQQLNTAAIKLWQQSPLIGIGLGNFLVELPKALPSRAIYFLQPVHNIYLLVLVETGVAGLILFLWVIWKAFMRFEIRKIRKPFSIYHLEFSILLLLGLVDHYPLTLQQGQLLFALLLSFSMIQ